MVGALGALALLASCSEKKPEPAPLLDDCIGNDCKASGGNGSGDGTGGGQGGDDDTIDGGATTVTVTGTVMATVDEGFLAAAAFTGAAEVHARGEGGADIVSETAAGQFTIDDVATGSNWFALDEKHAQRLMMPTLQPVRVRADNPTATLVGIDQSQFLMVLNNLVPTQIAHPNSGHAILFFVRDDVPVQGVSIKRWASAEVVAYDIAAGYETAAPPDESGTGERGTALLVNMPATAFPGSSVDIHFEVDGVPRAASIQLASGYVTRVAIAVP